jgi:hypothetical protein
VGGAQSHRRPPQTFKSIAALAYHVHEKGPPFSISTHACGNCSRLTIPKRFSGRRQHVVSVCRVASKLWFKVSYAAAHGKCLHEGLLVILRRSPRDLHIPSPLIKSLRVRLLHMATPLSHSASLIALTAHLIRVLPHSPTLPLFLFGPTSSPFPLSSFPLRCITPHDTLNPLGSSPRLH